jgi:hypothetical protein
MPVICFVNPTPVGIEYDRALLLLAAVVLGAGSEVQGRVVLISFLAASLLCSGE